MHGSRILNVWRIERGLSGFEQIFCAFFRLDSPNPLNPRSISDAMTRAVLFPIEFGVAGIDEMLGAVGAFYDQAAAARRSNDRPRQ